jgi:hypothetical protein
MDVPIPKKAWPIINKFLVYPDPPDKETEAGIILTAKFPKFTGTVVKLPADIKAFDSRGSSHTKFDTEKHDAGTFVVVGSRIQWSSQTGFAVPVTIDVDGEEIEYLLFTIRDVDLILDV